MAWITITLQLLAKLPDLMAVAEKAFDGVLDSNAQKKEMVLTAVKAIVSGVLGVSTGGQAETWARIESVISPAIDFMCLFLFKDEKK